MPASKIIVDASAITLGTVIGFHSIAAGVGQLKYLYF